MDVALAIHFAMQLLEIPRIIMLREQSRQDGNPYCLFLS